VISTFAWPRPFPLRVPQPAAVALDETGLESGDGRPIAAIETATLDQGRVDIEEAV